MRPPNTLALITSFRCTAACSECCFSCSPIAKSPLMSLRRMKHYIDTALTCFGESLRLLVITGGECFLLGAKLRLIVAYAAKRGLLVRVVTNAYWATSYGKAFRMLKHLKRLGLSEVNFSTGDEHSAWVPMDNVIYGSMAACELGVTCIVNVEQHGQDNAYYDQFMSDPRIANLSTSHSPDRFRVIAGIWMPTSNPERGKNAEASNRLPIPDSMRACDSLLTTITLSPHGELYACCGLTVRRNSYLQRPLPLYPTCEQLMSAYRSFLDDFLLLWISVKGAHSVYQSCCIKGVPEGMAWSKNAFGIHSCAVCRILFSRPMLERVSSAYKAHRAEVFSRLDLGDALAGKLTN